MTPLSIESVLEQVKRQVRGIKAYTLAPLEAPIKLNQNENPFGMPAEIREEVLARIGQCDWARYPDFVPTRLLNQLAAYTGWVPDGVMAGNGSNEMIQSVIQATIEPGKKVVLPEPTFSVYRQVITVAGGEICSVPLTHDLQFDLPALRSAIGKLRPAMTIVCAPNNPTGSTLSRAELAILLEEAAPGLVVVDQAYLEIGGEDAVPLLPDHPNLVILRTFSKAMAMGGLRVGYCLADPALIREFNKAKMPYSLNVFSMIAAEVALERRDLLDPLVKAMAAEKDRLATELARLPGVHPSPSVANFLLVEVPLPPGVLFARLHERGILVRDLSQSPLLSRHLRISVGTPEENRLLLTALREIILGEGEAA